MRTVLLVHAAYPPHSSPASHRGRFLTRYSKRFGWNTEVLGVDPSSYRATQDPELLRLTPDDVPVTRVRALPQRLTGPLGVGDLGLRSYFPMRRALGRILGERAVDVIFLPGWPFYSFRLGLWASRRFGVPYVLDYTDPWVFALTPEQSRRTSKSYWSDRAARALEPAVARGASHILAVSELTHAGLRERLPDIPSDRFSATPFGFEAADFDVLRAEPRSNPYWDANDGNVHLVYVGAMLPHGFETLRALFAAFVSMRCAEPDRYRRVRMHFFGTTYDPNADDGLVTPVAEEMGLGDVVSEHPRRIPYLDALNVLTQAHGVLSLGSSERHYTASKIYPCILARRPLLALYHEGSTVRDVMREADVDELVTYGDECRAENRVSAITAALGRLVARAEDRTPTRSPNLAEMHAYSAERSVEHIIAVFDRVAGLRR